MQNFAPLSTEVPQLGQAIPWAAPHWGQNLVPVGIIAWHLMQGVLEGGAMASMESLTRHRHDLKEVVVVLVGHFSRVFERQLQELPRDRAAREWPIDF